MDDPRGRPLDLSPQLPVLAEFWPSAVLGRNRLTCSAGLEAADEVLRDNIDYSQPSFATTPGGARIRIWEKNCFPNSVALTAGSHPDLYRKLRETIALLPPGVLDVLGKGKELCFATYEEPMTPADRTGTRKMGLGQGPWLLLIGHEVADAPDDAGRGILIHELLHILIGRSEAFRPYMGAWMSRDRYVARGANDEIEEKVVRLACELGFIAETRAYLAYLEKISRDEGGNARFREIVESYPLKPSPLVFPAARPNAGTIRSSPLPCRNRAYRRGPPR